MRATQLHLLRKELTSHRMELEFVTANGYRLDRHLIGETIRLSRATGALTDAERRSLYQPLPQAC